MDPVWLAASLSGTAALLAALAAATAAFRPARSDPALALLADALDDLRGDLAGLRTVLAEDGRRARDEGTAQSRQLREEVAGLLDRLGGKLDGTLEKAGAVQAARGVEISGTVRELATANERRLAELRQESQDGGKALRAEILRGLEALGGVLGQRLDGAADSQKERLDGVAKAINSHVQRSAEAHESLRRTVEGRLEAMRTDNEAKLEEMRRTVDEKLQGTLEERLGEKFKLVSDQLANVFRSVGEMQNLAQGVGDLKRVLTNVKSRGTWAEVSLGAVLEQVLAPDQFIRNAAVRPGSDERVEYAVRLPGQTDDERGLLLPIDAKFPVEDYERLLDASERADAAGIETALRGLETRIRQEGAKICAKYVVPPHTTDFGILYLPTEGLYAEVIRRPGLVDHLQGQCRIVVAGPTVLLAILNSLRMGFRTLAIQQRSGEVFQTLAAVKTEFGKYGDVLDAVKKKLAQASDQIEKVSVRGRAIERKLRGVETMPDGEAGELLKLDTLIEHDFLDAAE